MTATIAQTVAAAAAGLAALDIDASVTIEARGCVRVQIGYGFIDEDRIRLVDAAVTKVGDGDWKPEAGFYDFPTNDTIGYYGWNATINGIGWHVWCPLSTRDAILRLQAQIGAAA